MDLEDMNLERPKHANNETNTSRDVSNENRRRIIALVVEDGYTIKKAASTLRIYYSTTRS
jgi:transposase-like protein